MDQSPGVMPGMSTTAADAGAPPGPRRRDLLEASSRTAPSPRRQADRHERPRAPALRLLIDLGLLSDDQAAGGCVPVDPATVQRGSWRRWAGRAASCSTSRRRGPTCSATLGQAFRRSDAGSASPLTELRGCPTSTGSSTPPVDDAETELLAAQPAGARRAAVARAGGRTRHRALHRGVRMRMMYQHSARRSQATREYVERSTELGAEVRTLDEFFNRMIVIDRRLAVIPGMEGRRWRSRSTSPAWSRTSSTSSSGTGSGRAASRTASPAPSATSPSSSRNMTVRMLAEGHSDPASAKRVGVSARTYAGLRRCAQGRVRRPDPLPARLRDGPADRPPSVASRRRAGCAEQSPEDRTRLSPRA